MLQLPRQFIKLPSGQVFSLPSGALLVCNDFLVTLQLMCMQKDRKESQMRAPSSGGILAFTGVESSYRKLLASGCIASFFFFYFSYFFLLSSPSPLLFLDCIFQPHAPGQRSFKLGLPNLKTLHILIQMSFASQSCPAHNSI